MNHDFPFTFARLEHHFTEILANGYEVITCLDYYNRKKTLPNKTLVNRVDIDCDCLNAIKLADLFNKLSIKGSFFVRLHAPEYNPFSFENYRILKEIRDSGHEIGYHCEPIDCSTIWDEDPEKCLTRDIAILETMLNIKIHGAACHSGLTGLNNLDFWEKRNPAQFGLKYEAYDKQKEFNLFQEAFYVSDSNWTHWKCYDKGRLISGDSRSLGEHSRDAHPLLYSLIHSDTYYRKHCYEF